MQARREREDYANTALWSGAAPSAFRRSQRTTVARTMAARLAPLSAAEIAFAVAQTRRWAAGRQLVFYEIDLHEAASTEAKEAALRGEWEALPRRRARVVAGRRRGLCSSATSLSALPTVSHRGWLSALARSRRSPPRSTLRRSASS